MDIPPIQLAITLAIGFLAFCAMFSISTVLLVIIHELGHAIPALMTGKKQVRIKVGDASDREQQPRSNTIQFLFSFKNSHRALTRYEGGINNWAELIFIVGTAPLINLVIGVSATLALLTTHLSSVWVFVVTAFWLANARIFLHSIDPGWFSRWEPGGSDSCESDLGRILRGPNSR